mmetsp:Transcript_68323/g.142377  ORF Transcript_68323/g.142377 Transcript_68323/m.142377 type:complete len:292 (+) Transcript_68323:946-1821(+)
MSCLLSSLPSSISLSCCVNFLRMMPFSPLRRRCCSRSAASFTSYLSLSSSISWSASSSTCRRVSSSSRPSLSLSSLTRCNASCSSCSLYSYSSVSSCTRRSWLSTSSEFCSSQRSLSSSFSSISCWYRSTSLMIFCWYCASVCWVVAAWRSSMLLMRSSYSSSMSVFSPSSIAYLAFSASMSSLYLSAMAFILSLVSLSLSRSWYPMWLVSSSTLFLRSLVFCVFSSRSLFVTRISSENGSISLSRFAARISLSRTSMMSRHPSSETVKRCVSSYVMHMRVTAREWHWYSW